MDTRRIMQLALELAGLDEIPADSAIYQPGEDIERVIIGIDIDTTELILAEAEGYDLAISHHPMGGTALINFHRVFARHIDLLVTAGVPRDAAEQAVLPMMEEQRIAHAMRNYDRAPSIARLIDMPYMNIHTPLDEIGRRRMADACATLAPTNTVADLIEHFRAVFGEFRHALTAIEPAVGALGNQLGRIAVAHGAGTNGGYPVAKAYFTHGIDTVIYIHCAPRDIMRLRQEFPDNNLVVTGHIASDSVGINPFIAALEDNGMEVTAISGIVAP